MCKEICLHEAMKLICKQIDLALALNLANRAVSPNNTLPVLNNILLKAEGKKVFLSATNLEIAISSSFEADIENEGSLTIPAKIFTSYVSLLEDKEVELTVTNGNTLIIKSPGSETRMKGISSEEFPSAPKIEKGDSFKFPVKPVLEALEQVVFAASTNTSRPVLTGIFWKVVGRVVKLAATDSYRLGEKQFELSKDLGMDTSFIVPSKTAQELQKILENSKDEELEVRVGKGQIQFKVDGAELVSRLIEGNFPDYDKILPKETKTTAVLSTEEFLLGLKKVSVIVRENSNNVKVRIEKGKLLIFSDETQVGQGATEIVVENVKGEALETALNVQYLLDVLSHLKDTRVNFSLNDGLSPVMVTPAKTSGYIHIIMPLKV
ncbi:DNA polymerase III subunit beta [Candidatus Peregrinibacteria bacterium RIFCSPLOWO2_02_FULL_48_14]|nr:MAG: DNA polymerase III subunit beta [Candidatus Peregrinibacteria bacterium RIFCSPLOWO2_01_FULL_48_20]OGJ43925.1 MAG: DNA polymerase III subunit beta [Candidatus Peregrinibacteria bacterium RIFCSPLOWO2_02_FULL_48_14]